MGDYEVSFSKLLGVLMCSVMVIIVTSVVANDLVSRGLSVLLSPMFVVEVCVLIMSVFSVVVLVASDKGQ